MNIKDAAKRWFAKDSSYSQTKEPYMVARTQPVQEGNNRLARDISAPPQCGVDPDYLRMIHEAWKQWQGALNYFEHVTDPELVDYAIYDVEAARRRYIYMLKQAEVH